MSVFKRLSNVAKGKIKEMGRSLGEVDPFAGSDDPELDPPTPPPPRVDSHDDKLELLDRMKADGLLTDEEYEVKRARLQPAEAPSDPDDAPSTPRKPMKRNL